MFGEVCTRGRRGQRSGLGPLPLVTPNLVVDIDRPAEFPLVGNLLDVVVLDPTGHCWIWTDEGLSVVELFNPAQVSRRFDELDPAS